MEGFGTALALAIGGFGIGLTEFVIAGLLPEVADDFAVDEATAGWLISGYALSVAVGAIGLTAAVTRYDREKVLTALMVLFIAGNLLSAIAPTYEVMMLGRVLSALTHGAFFGIGSVVAANLVEPAKKAGAIALMLAGLTSATVPWLLVLFGVGLFAGNYLGGKEADRSVSRTLTFALGALAIVMIAFAPVAESKAPGLIALVLMGAFGFSTVRGLQMRIMHFAGDAPTLSSGSNIAAFNVGNAIGAWLGGLTITAGLGYTSTLWVGGAMAAAALIVLLAADRAVRDAAPASEMRELVSA
ncbi:MFS transporter [Yimella sp. cx-51]|uniref:MFS transporter n=1 Tax=Yimella sp. cx-51 TaxID=2770551 RepID=UPI00165DC93B|nr:MFS transporter [Yimella sp. cx-51]MBC9955506.1 MFS transporter [Yimella sp. cx-51]QTH37908.1 MFS transporter [Yimella sp. cx-51]